GGAGSCPGLAGLPARSASGSVALIFSWMPRKTPDARTGPAARWTWSPLGCAWSKIAVVPQQLTWPRPVIAAGTSTMTGLTLWFRKGSVKGFVGRCGVRSGVGLGGGAESSWERQGDREVVEEGVGALAGEDLDPVPHAEDLTRQRVGRRDDRAGGGAAGGVRAGQLRHCHVLVAVGLGLGEGE